MSRRRLWLLAALGAVSLALAYLLRDVMYSAVIVPLAYAFWLGRLYYSAIPQWILWSLLLAALFLTTLWNLLPDARVTGRKEEKRRPAEGQVEALAVWIEKSRHGNYFKWQLANRLGRIARRMNEDVSSRALPLSGDDALDKYFDAGLNYSFVDFPSPRSRFERAPRTPLDLDPRKAAGYLESEMEKTSGRRG